MDVLDHLSEHHTCGRCGRRITYTDDFCTNCRRPPPTIGEQVDLLDLLEADRLQLAETVTRERFGPVPTSRRGRSL